MSVKIPVNHSCGGDIVAGPGDFTCLGCGEMWATPIKRREFYQEYRSSIQVDLDNNGDEWVIEHWGISKSALGQIKRTLSEIKQTLSVPEPEPEEKEPVPEPEPEEKEPDPEPDPPAAAGPFGLPAWSNAWPFAVQLKWLEIFLYLTIEGKKEG